MSFRFSERLRVPIVLIGGYLGSGKTSLINHLLTNNDGRKIAVFVNDFGAINLDLDLIDTQDENKISFKDGCVCCTLNDDFVRTITEFLNGEDKPDCIVIETSGVADPRQLGSSLVALENAGLGRFDAHVYVVDALNFNENDFEVREMIIEHAASADTILINKSDLVTDEQIQKIRTTLKEVTANAAFLESRFAQVDNAVVFGPSVSRRDENFISNEIPAGNHSKTYRSFSKSGTGYVDRDKFDRFALKLPKTCYRAKGILRFYHNPESWYQFNQVGNRATLERSAIDSHTHDELCKLIVIAKEYDVVKSEINAMLSDLFE